MSALTAANDIMNPGRAVAYPGRAWTSRRQRRPAHYFSQTITSDDVGILGVVQERQFMGVAAT